MGDRIFVVTVLYNCNIEDIASIAHFRELKERHNNVEIIVVDNSELSYRMTHQHVVPEDIVYIDSKGNLGLSKAYNRAIQYIEDKDYWVVFADDDTFFSIDFLENLYKTASLHEVDVISGVIKADEKVLSPLKRNAIRPRTKDFIDTPGLYKNIYCINSGLAIHSKVLRTIGPYDETLFLDLLDYWFMDQLIDSHINTIEIVEGEINQRFSGNDKTNISAVDKRFNIYRKDFCRYCALTNKSPIYKYGVLMKRMAHLYFIKVDATINSLKK